MILFHMHLVKHSEHLCIEYVICVSIHFHTLKKAIVESRMRNALITVNASVFQSGGRMVE